VPCKISQLVLKEAILNELLAFSLIEANGEEVSLPAPCSMGLVQEISCAHLCFISQSADQLPSFHSSTH
jgi:hypothetical protein